MDVAGVVFASLIIVMAIPFAIEIRRRREGDKTLSTIALVAAVLLGAVNVVKSLGLMTDGPVYWTLNFALAVLFWAMLLQLSRGRDAARRKREGNAL
jgi:lipopolysaccharide export LptBFGC system permease protein LptF